MKIIELYFLTFISNALIDALKDFFLVFLFFSVIDIAQQNFHNIQELFFKIAYTVQVA